MRRGLVLGGGSVLGAAWTIGALASIEEVKNVAATDFDVVVGTSAGSVVAAMLKSGISTTQMLRHQSGLQILDGPLAGYIWNYDATTGDPLPGRPRLRGANPRYLVRNITRLHQMPPIAVAAALVPEGTGTLNQIRHLVSTVSSGKSWPEGLWINAFDYELGRRVLFGSPDAPRPDLADAVCASCAVPGWYSPIIIDGTRYVDGGTWSPTSADTLLEENLDEVVVLAPMASFDIDHPKDFSTIIERVWRVRVTKRLVREVGRLRRKGVKVTVLTPTYEDLEVMGGDFMDAARRAAVLELSLKTTRRSLALGH